VIIVIDANLNDFLDLPNNAEIPPFFTFAVMITPRSASTKAIDNAKNRVIIFSIFSLIDIHLLRMIRCQPVKGFAGKNVVPPTGLFFPRGYFNPRHDTILQSMDRSRPDPALSNGTFDLRLLFLGRFGTCPYKVKRSVQPMKNHVKLHIIINPVIKNIVIFKRVQK